MVKKTISNQNNIIFIYFYSVIIFLVCDLVIITFQIGGCQDEQKLISTTIEKYVLCYYCYNTFQSGNIRLEIEPEPK